jgi:hypothetical protein
MSVTYKGKTVNIPKPTTDYSQFTLKLRQGLPELKFNHFFITTTDSPASIISNQAEYSTALRKHKLRLRARIELVPNITFPSQVWRNAASAVFKLKSSEEVYGTGFLITRTIAVVSAEPLQGGSLHKLSALFHNGVEVAFDKSSLLVEFPRDQDKAMFALVKLSAPSEESIVPIPLLPSAPAVQVACVLHYTKREPVLKSVKATLKASPHKFSWFEADLAEGSSGAPMLSEDCKLVGVYTANPIETRCTAFNIDALLLQLKDTRESLSGTPAVMEAIDEIFDFSGIVSEDSVILTLSDVAPEVTPRRVAVSAQPLIESRQAELELERAVFYINYKEGSVVVCPQDYERELKFPCGEAFSEGCACVYTPQGLFITGANAKVKNAAWLWTSAGLVSLPAMLESHESHCSLYYKARVYVIGGLYSASAECFHDNAWSYIEPLPETRISSSGVVFNDLMYVIGGQAGVTQPLSDLIFTSDGTHWTTLEVRLTSPLSGAGVIVLDDRLLLFGGKTQEEDSGRSVDNVDSWIVEASGAQHLGPQFRRPGLYSSVQAVQQPPFVYLYSRTGQLVRYDSLRERFAIITLGQELL